MGEVRFAIAETALGAFGVAWTDRGIARTWMHARTVAATREQIRRTYPDAVESEPPPAIAEAIYATVALLRGEKADLTTAKLDMSEIPDFDRRVYEQVRRIAAGSTATYGEIAKLLGEDPRLARDVGIAMARNRFAPIVPCHRVVAAGGQLGGYSAPGGASTKRRLLEIERAPIVTHQIHQLGLFK
jgi:methylated-DNA-[protein]-cysteine S-methyltransferase